MLLIAAAAAGLLVGTPFIVRNGMRRQPVRIATRQATEKVAATHATHEMPPAEAAPPAQEKVVKSKVAQPEPPKPDEPDKPKPPGPDEPKPPKPPGPDEPDDLRPLAKAVITTMNGEPAPKAWPLGVPIGLTCVKSIAGDHPQSIRWEIWPLWVNKWTNRSPDGRSLNLATGTKPKTIRVTLYVAKDDTFDMTTATIVVRADPNEPGDGDGPGPGPGPGPVPPDPKPPDPDIPPQPPLSAMAQQVKDLAIQYIPDIKNHKAQVLALAVSHETIANDVSQAVAGVPAYAHLKQPKAIIDATVASNRAAVAGDRDPYVPFFNALNGILKPLSTTTLSTAGGHIGVWQDIAAGLRAAAP
jgi:hypothetical protein